MTYKLNTHIPSQTIYNNIKLNRKKLNLGLFFSRSCFISSYSQKTKSNNDSRIKTLFWASFILLLINYTPEKVGFFRIFVISWVCWVCVNDE